MVPRLFSVLAMWLQAYEPRVTVKPPSIGLRARGPLCMSQWPGRARQGTWEKVVGKIGGN